MLPFYAYLWVILYTFNIQDEYMLFNDSSKCYNGEVIKAELYLYITKVTHMSWKYQACNKILLIGTT